MAHKDYVSRPANKKNNPYKPKQQQEAVGVSLKTKFIAVITLALLAGFAYFLWSIKDQKVDDAQIIETSENNKINTPKTSSIPEYKDDGLGYMNELKHKEVEGGKYETPKTSQYGLYCASFRQYSRAETLKAQIAFAGVASQIRTKTGSNGTWHQVLIGPYPNKRAGEAEKHKLIRNKVPDCTLRKWK